MILARSLRLIPVGAAVVPKVDLGGKSRRMFAVSAAFRPLHVHVNRG